MKFAICAGHGKNDPGATYEGYTERDLMVLFRDKIAGSLRELGHTVVTDGNRGENLPLNEAIKLIKGCDVAIELHTNAAENMLAEGVEALSLEKDKILSQRLCNTVSKCLLRKVRGDNGWKSQEESARGKLGFVTAGGIVLEVFFLSSPKELRKFLVSESLLARNIAILLHTLK